MRDKLLLRFLTIPAAILFLSLVPSAARAANFVVTNTNDSGAGSLRAAIDAANSNGQPDTITFDSVFFSIARTITLTDELMITADGSGQLLTITGSPVAGRITISGNDATRIFLIRRDAPTVISGLTLTDGDATGLTLPDFDSRGGAIFNNEAASVTLTDVRITNSTAKFRGGGIQNLATPLTLNNCVVLFNTVSNSDATFESGNGLGGGIANTSAGASLTVNNSNVSRNSATSTISGQGGRGGGIYNEQTATITNSNISFNSATSPTTTGGVGGGIQNNATLNVANSTIASNLATDNGGGIQAGLSSVNTLNNVHHRRQQGVQRRRGATLQHYRQFVCHAQLDHRQKQRRQHRPGRARR